MSERVSASASQSFSQSVSQSACLCNWKLLIKKAWGPCSSRSSSSRRRATGCALRVLKKLRSEGLDWLLLDSEQPALPDAISGRHFSATFGDTFRCVGLARIYELGIALPCESFERSISFIWQHAWFVCALFVVYVTVCCRGINTITKKLLVMMSCVLVVCVCCCGINIVTKKL